MERSAAAVSGLLLCRAGPHRLAFPASQVAGIEASANLVCPHARNAFALPPAPGRVLMTEEGAALLVDEVQVTQEPLPVMPTPPMVKSHAGGSLFGFVTVQDALWPVLKLREFSDYLKRQGATANG
jgi:hypothetical protein